MNVNSVLHTGGRPAVIFIISVAFGRQPLLLAFLGVLATKFIDTTRRINNFLFTCVERVAF